MRLVKSSTSTELPVRELPDRSAEFSAQLVAWVQKNKEVLPLALQNRLLDEVISLFENTRDILTTQNKRSYLNHVTAGRRAARGIRNLLHLIEAAQLPLAAPFGDFRQENELIQNTLNSLYHKAKQAVEGEVRE